MGAARGHSHAEPGEGPAGGGSGAILAAKTALYEALPEQRLSNSAFAVALAFRKAKSAACWTRPTPTKIGRLEEALARFRSAW